MDAGEPTLVRASRPSKAPTHTTQTCTPASKNDIFRHLRMLVHNFLHGHRAGDPFSSVPFEPLIGDALKPLIGDALK